jgi:hypothetical protein
LFKGNGSHRSAFWVGPPSSEVERLKGYELRESANASLQGVFRVRKRGRGSAIPRHSGGLRPCLTCPGLVTTRNMECGERVKLTVNGRVRSGSPLGGQTVDGPNVIQQDPLDQWLAIPAMHMMYDMGVVPGGGPRTRRSARP